MQLTEERRTGRSVRARRRERTDEPGARRYRRLAAQQSIFCAALFAAALFVRVHNAPACEYAGSCIRYVLTDRTEWVEAAKSAGNFMREHFFSKQEEREELEPLANMRAPVEGEIVSGFGLRSGPDGEESFHYGVDYAGTEGEPIRCAADGVVREVGSNEEFGNFILIAHNETLCSFYGHCGSVLPAADDAVEVGQAIATMGEAGTDGPKLHFEIREGDTSLDPSAFLED